MDIPALGKRLEQEKLIRVGGSLLRGDDVSSSTRMTISSSPPLSSSATLRHSIDLPKPVSYFIPAEKEDEEQLGDSRKETKVIKKVKFQSPRSSSSPLPTKTEKGETDAYHSDHHDHYDHGQVQSKGMREGKDSFEMDDDVVAGSTSMREPSLPVALHPIGRFEDSQTIRGGCFCKRSGFENYFAVGSNTRALRICQLPPKGLRRVQQMDESGRRQVYGDANGGDILPVSVAFEKEEHHFGSIYSVDFDPTGSILVSGSNDRTLRMISFLNDEELWKTDECEWSETVLGKHTSTIRCVKFMQQTSHVVSVGSDLEGGNVKIWDARTGTLFRSYDGHPGHTVHGVGIHPSNDIIVTVGDDCTIKMWDIRSPHPEREIVIQDCGYSICFGPSDGGGDTFSIFCGLRNGDVSKIDFRDGVRREDLTFHLHDDECRSIDYHHRTHRLVSTGFDGTVAIVDAQTGSVLNKMLCHDGKVTCGIWNAPGDVLLTTSTDATAIAWRLLPQL
eukprot:TRINITY_DN2489_c0_g1_i1.p1 TRINITY_DN2489_c0_g1~~TRINITY_DN2489_c0_g1_i1.p1  ORF type:complete len:573 (-),score=192.35 TRINITY_DN2489_c0_g1_i1:39-1547(-)